MSTENDPRTPAHEVLPFFQPFYNLRTGRIQGWEALARHRRAGDGATGEPSTRAWTGPGMRDVDLRILDGALEQLAAWRAESSAPDVIVAVNLSGELVDDGLLVSDITNALYRHGVPGDRLLVDLTTDGFRRLLDDDAALARLRELQRHEITFCLDGFTVDDLDVLPVAARTRVDIIKLHPRQWHESDDPEPALSTIARAAQDLDLPVVAAGVETDEQLALVRRLGFEWAQGFLLGGPVPAQEIRTHPVTAPLEDAPA